MLTATPAGSVPILVKFKAGAADAEVDLAVRSLGGQRTGTITALRTVAISVPAESRDAIIATYGRQPLVERASPAIKLYAATTVLQPAMGAREDGLGPGLRRS